jgi:malonyl CoA-acyl carrier protein transacylase
VLALRERGARRFVEVGPGRVLTGLVRKTLDDVETDVVSPEAACA